MGKEDADLGLAASWSGQRQKMDQWLNNANESITDSLIVVILVGAVECGALLARLYRARDGNRDADRFLFNLATPSLGLLALMIGFTFAMSLSGFQARTAAVLDEANAIGSAALRGRMLTEPYSTAVAPLFKQYAQLRVAHRGAAGLLRPACIIASRSC